MKLKYAKLLSRWVFGNVLEEKIFQTDLHRGFGGGNPSLITE